MSAFITTKQAAAYLNCTPQHLYNLRNKRKSAIEEGDKTLANKLAPEAIKIGGNYFLKNPSWKTGSVPTAKLLSLRIRQA